MELSLREGSRSSSRQSLELIEYISKKDASAVLPMAGAGEAGVGVSSVAVEVSLSTGEGVGPTTGGGGGLGAKGNHFFAGCMAVSAKIESGGEIEDYR